MLGYLTFRITNLSARIDNADIRRELDDILKCCTQMTNINDGPDDKPTLGSSLDMVLDDLIGDRANESETTDESDSVPSDITREELDAELDDIQNQIRKYHHDSTLTST